VGKRRKERIGCRGCGGETGASREEREGMWVVEGEELGGMLGGALWSRMGRGKEEDGSQEGDGEERWVGEPEGIVEGVDVGQEVGTVAVGW
jgi:hypothetical protein